MARPRITNAILLVAMLVVFAAGASACGGEEKASGKKEVVKEEPADDSADEDESSGKDEEEGEDVDPCEEDPDSDECAEQEGTDEEDDSADDATEEEDAGDDERFANLAPLPTSNEGEKIYHTMVREFEVPDGWFTLAGTESHAAEHEGNDGAAVTAKWVTTDDVDEVKEHVQENWVPIFKKLKYTESSEQVIDGFDLIKEIDDDGYKYVGYRADLDWNYRSPAPVYLLVRRIEPDRPYVEDALENNYVLSGFEQDGSTLYEMPYTEIQLVTYGVGREKGL